jgi:MinD-like ATPase involved in chromosome partitioning or flagellar assembly
VNSNGNGNGRNPRAAGLSSLFSYREPRQVSNASELRQLALQIHYELPRKDNFRSVLFTDPHDGWLSAQVAAALTRWLADEVGKPVLLVDASRLQSESSRMFECNGFPGFVELIGSPNQPLESLILPTSHPMVSFMPAGTGEALDIAGLPAAIQRILEACSQKFDFVVFAGGPVLSDPMVSVLSAQVGCVLLLVSENRTKLEQLESAQRVIGYCSPRKVGLVLANVVADQLWD